MNQTLDYKEFKKMVIDKSVDQTCPKCGGKIYVDGDTWGFFESCIACGYCKDLKVVKPLIKKVVK